MMLDALLKICLFLHFAALGGLALYGLHRLWLLWCWRRLRLKCAQQTASVWPGGRTLPSVVVQLPLYNERFVAGRLIDAVAQLQWPRNLLEIQVLDDSTDATREVVDERVQYWHQQGMTINAVRRAQRKGFKAGALGYGLELSKSELVAIFDADFVPNPDFLLQCLSPFQYPEVGMVQARWGFLNAKYNLLTRLQALLLGPHFSIEHQVRCTRGVFFNFNGTAGIWRRSAIESAGGWNADTVTEDLDLSYRAQLVGWRFVYLDHVDVPSELPVTLAAFRCQQQRWAKGSIQTARKLLPTIWKSTQPWGVKLEASCHLLANFGWLLGALVSLTLYPVLLQRTGIGPYQIMRLDLPIFLTATGAILLYFARYLHAYGRRGDMWCLPLLPMATLGLAPHLAWAVLQGIWQRGGMFLRTPKFGVSGNMQVPGAARTYLNGAMAPMLWSLMFFVYALLPLTFAWQQGTWLAFPFLLLFPAGFLLILYWDSCELFLYPA